MNLTKIFRKHSRMLLMIFMSLLLVVFLVGDVIQNMFQASDVQNVKIGRAETFGADLYYADIRSAEQKQAIIRRFRLIPGSLHPESYCLMLEEAKRMGIRVGRSQVEDFLRQNLQSQADAIISEIKQTNRASTATIFDAVGEALAIVQAWNIQLLAAIDSLPRQESRFRDQSQEAVIVCSAIDANALSHAVPDPTDEQLRALFEEGRDRDTAHTDDALVFGYRLPDRVRVEYLTVDPRQIESKVRVRAAEARRFHEQNAARYVKQVPKPTPEGAAPPNEPEFDIIPMTFEEAEEQVRNDYRQIKAIEDAQQLVNQLRDEAFAPWVLSARDESGFRTSPSNVVSFEELAQRFSERFPVIYQRSEAMDAAALRTFFGPRTPAYRTGQGVLTAVELAFRVPGLYTPIEGEEVLSLNEPSPVMITQDRIPVLNQFGPYQAFVFRVTEVAPAGPAESFEAARSRVEADFKLRQAFELAKQHAETLAGAARSSGLAAAVEQAGELRALIEAAEPSDDLTASQPARSPKVEQYLRGLGPFSPVGRFTRMTRFLVNVGSISAKMTEAVFGLDQSSGEHRIAIVPVPNQFKWVVIELKEIRPLHESEFEKERQRLVDQQERNNLQSGVLSREAIRERAGYKPLIELGDDPFQ